MVEGPGCTLNGEKIRARVRPGQAVTDVRGRALQGLGGPGSPPAASRPAGPSQVSSFRVSLGDQQWEIQQKAHRVSRVQSALLVRLRG